MSKKEKTYKYKELNDNIDKQIVKLFIENVGTGELTEITEACFESNSVDVVLGKTFDIRYKHNGEGDIINIILN